MRIAPALALIIVFVATALLVRAQEPPTISLIPEGQKMEVAKAISRREGEQKRSARYRSVRRGNSLRAFRNLVYQTRASQRIATNKMNKQVNDLKTLFLNSKSADEKARLKAEIAQVVSRASYLQPSKEEVKILLVRSDQRPAPPGLPVLLTYYDTKRDAANQQKGVTDGNGMVLLKVGQGLSYPLLIQVDVAQGETEPEWRLADKEIGEIKLTRNPDGTLVETAIRFTIERQFVDIAVEAPDGSKIVTAAAPGETFTRRVGNAIVCRLPLAAVAEKPIPLHVICQTKSGDRIGVIDDYDRGTVEENRVKAILSLTRVNEARISAGVDVGDWADHIQDIGNRDIKRVENTEGKPFEWWIYPQQGLTFIMHWRDGEDRNGRKRRDSLFVQRIRLSRRTDSSNSQNNRSQIAGIEPGATRTEVVGTLGEPQKELAPDILQLVDENRRRTNATMPENAVRKMCYMNETLVVGLNRDDRVEWIEIGRTCAELKKPLHLGVVPKSKSSPRNSLANR